MPHHSEARPAPAWCAAKSRAGAAAAAPRVHRAGGQGDHRQDGEHHERESATSPGPELGEQRPQDGISGDQGAHNKVLPAQFVDRSHELGRIARAVDCTATWITPTMRACAAGRNSSASSAGSTIWMPGAGGASRPRTVWSKRMYAYLKSHEIRIRAGGIPGTPAWEATVGRAANAASTESGAAWAGRGCLAAFTRRNNRLS